MKALKAFLQLCLVSGVCCIIAFGVWLVYLACWIIEDTKGVKTEGYIIKKHLMKAVHGIEVLET